MVYGEMGRIFLTRHSRGHVSPMADKSQSLGEINTQDAWTQQHKQMSSVKTVLIINCNVCVFCWMASKAPSPSTLFIVCCALCMHVSVCVSVSACFCLCVQEGAFDTFQKTACYT